jgi:IS605 OrfB family transposase
VLAQGEQDNQALWDKIRHRDESFAHLVSRRIVQFAKEHGASILVFEHLGKLKPEKGKYSRRGNSKRAFPISGRIFSYAKYKAWQEGIITSRVNPRNTSRECARCHGAIIRYAAGQPVSGSTTGAPLALCPACGMRGHADRNASIVIGQRLITRYQEKPPPPLFPEREPKGSGVVVSQDAENGSCGPSLLSARHGEDNAPGTAHESKRTDGSSLSDMPPPLRSHRGRRHAASAPETDYGSVSEAAGL